MRYRAVWAPLFGTRERRTPVDYTTTGWSRTNNLYGFKTEISVLPNGLAIGASVHHPGSVSDTGILRHNLAWHRDALSKAEAEMNTVLNVATLMEKFEGLWGVIMDKGYQGSCEFIRAVLPNVV